MDLVFVDRKLEDVKTVTVYHIFGLLSNADGAASVLLTETNPHKHWGFAVFRDQRNVQVTKS